MLAIGPLQILNPSRASFFAVFMVVLSFFFSLGSADVTTRSISIGLPLIGFGIFIRLLTNANLKKNQIVCRKGLYALCRHPMYVGTISAATGIALTLNTYLAISFLFVVLAISFHRIRKEEQYLCAHFPEYLEYQTDIPVFPTVGSILKAKTSHSLSMEVSLHQCFKNGEVARFNMYLSLILVVGLYLQTSGKLVLNSVLFEIGAISLLIVAIASFILHPREVRRRKSSYILSGVVSICLLAIIELPSLFWTRTCDPSLDLKIEKRKSW